MSHATSKRRTFQDNQRRTETCDHTNRPGSSQRETCAGYYSRSTQSRSGKNGAGRPRHTQLSRFDTSHTIKRYHVPGSRISFNANLTIAPKQPNWNSTINPQPRRSALLPTREFQKSMTPKQRANFTLTQIRISIHDPNRKLPAAHV